MRKIPGPKTMELIARHEKVLAATTHDQNFPVSVEWGNGVCVWDADGNEYIDCFSQVSIADIGYGNHKVIEAVRRQAGKLMSCIGTDVYNGAQIEAAEKLTEITKKSFPEKDWRVYFCSSGGEANIAAVKLLIDRRPERKRFISFLGAFHGRFGYALDAASSKSLHKRDFPQALSVINTPYPDCRHCAYEMIPSICNQLCIRIIEKEYLGRLCDPDEINGVIMEPIQGEGGLVVPNAPAIKKLYEFCLKYDWALIDDEVQTGLGRTGKMFGIEHFRVTPDVICLAKKLGSGIPIGAIIFPKDWNFSRPGRHSTTFGGGPLGWAAAKATIEVIEEENLVANAAETGKYLLAKLKEIQHRFNKDYFTGWISNVRGLGLMVGVEFVDAQNKPNPNFRNLVLRECLECGIIPLAAGHPQRNPIIRFLPPLIVTKDDIDEIAAKFEKALNNAAKQQI